MPQPACESFVEAIQQLTQDLSAIDEQLHTLEVEGMSQLNPWRYLALQPQVDRLIKNKHALQDSWNRAMTELAICRSGQLSPHHP
jgi:predicted  nucleic acid-binding Zn-ribbon protein